MNRVGQKFRVLNVDGDTTLPGVGEVMVCEEYRTSHPWPIFATTKIPTTLHVALQESEVEWIDDEG